MCARADRDRPADPQRGRRRRQRRRAVRRAHGPRRHRRRVGARLAPSSTPTSDKRPTVQIGDPFEEKKLLECSLELLEHGLLVALQDLGAAGLTSSSAEMAAKGEVGLDLDVRKVPLREAGMEPFEIMVSESQERMLCVVEPARLDDVLAVCARWEVNATAIGEVTDTRRLRVFDGDELVGDMPVAALVDECPAYDLAPAEPTVAALPGARGACSATAAARGALLALLGSRQPRLAPLGVRAVRLRSSARAPCAGPSRPTPRCCCCPTRRPNGDLAALWPLHAPLAPRPAIAVAIDGNGRRVAADPYRGAVEAVLECSANLACVGAEPLGLTNCLNFGNPEKPHIAWQLTRGDRRPRRRLPRARRAGRGRQRLALQRGRRGPDLPDAGRRHGRRAARRARAPAGSASPREGDAIALITARPGRRRWPPPSCPSCAASRSPGRCPAADLGELKALHAAVRQAVRARRAALRPRRRRGRRRGRAGRVRAWPAGSARRSRGLASEERACSARARAPSWSPARRASLRAFGAAARVIGEVGGDDARDRGRRCDARPDRARARARARLERAPATRRGHTVATRCSRTAGASRPIAP